MHFPSLLRLTTSNFSCEVGVSFTSGGCPASPLSPLTALASSLHLLPHSTRRSPPLPLQTPFPHPMSPLPILPPSLRKPFYITVNEVQIFVPCFAKPRKRQSPSQLLAESSSTPRTTSRPTTLPPPTRTPSPQPAPHDLLRAEQVRFYPLPHPS